MNCGEFRRWFALLLSGEDAEDCPEREYHRHLLECGACRMLLSTEEISEAVATVASTQACSADELLLGEEVLKRTYRKIAIRRMIGRVSASMAICAALLVAFLLWPRQPEKGSELAQGNRPPEDPIVAAEPITPEQFARRLANEDFRYRKGSAVKTTHALTFVFDRQDPTADQYEFVKTVALSGFEQVFPDAPMAFISVAREDDLNLLGVLVDRSALGMIGPELRERPAPEFLRSFRLHNDLDGRIIRAGQGRE